MNYAGLNVPSWFGRLVATHIPFWETNPTLQAHLYPVQYEFKILEQSLATYTGWGSGFGCCGCGCG